MNEMSNRLDPRERARADLYRLLSACYYQPEAAFLEEDVFGQLEEAAARVCPDLQSDAAALGDGFRDTDLQELTLDYTRLFLGPFDIRAKPYGSIYLDGDGTVMGASTANVLALYREGGFEIADDIHEVPDHVALELEFAYLLSLALAEPAVAAEHARRRNLKRRFVEAHLGRWISRLADAMRAGAETDFYRRLADLTQRVVLQDRRELGQRTGTA
ncbi:MAG: molecular chaperone TorD family protein [Hyphomicrobiales bacterium]|nr:molecular chaperone TorD family protein [Hyphomicrobiales bacterium]